MSIDLFTPSCLKLEWSGLVLIVKNAKRLKGGKVHMTKYELFFFLVVLKKNAILVMLQM